MDLLSARSEPETDEQCANLTPRAVNTPRIALHPLATGVNAALGSDSAGRASLSSPSPESKQAADPKEMQLVTLANVIRDTQLGCQLGLERKATTGSDLQGLQDKESELRVGGGGSCRCSHAVDAQ